MDGFGVVSAGDVGFAEGYVWFGGGGCLAGEGCLQMIEAAGVLSVVDLGYSEVEIVFG